MRNFGILSPFRPLFKIKLRFLMTHQDEYFAKKNTALELDEKKKKKPFKLWKLVLFSLFRQVYLGNRKR